MIPTADRTIFPAHACLQRQLSGRQLYVVSLDALWRASGSPAGLDPASWLRRAGEMVQAVSWYIDRLDPECLLLNEGVRSAVWSWRWHLEPRGDWKAGDTLARSRPWGACTRSPWTPGRGSRNDGHATPAVHDTTAP